MKFIGSSLIILILSVCVFSQKKNFAVSVSVESSDAKLSRLVQFQLESDLEKLGDIYLGSRDPFYRLSVIVATNQTKEEVFGYSVFTVVSHQSQCTDGVLDEKGLNKWTCYVFEDSFANLSGPHNLKQTLTEVIEDFNTRSLTPLRKKK